MAFQRVPNTAEAAVTFNMQGVPVIMTFYAQRSLGYNEAQIAALAAAVDDWAGDQVRPLISSQVTYVATNVRGLDAENDLQATSAVGAGAGGLVQTPLPNNVALAVKRSSGLTGRSARGRVYFPGLTVNALGTNENFFTTTIVDDIVEVLNALRVILEAIGWIEVIVSRYINNTKRSEAVVFPVTFYTATDLRVDSRRDRLP